MCSSRTEGRTGPNTVPLARFSSRITSSTGANSASYQMKKSLVSPSNAVFSNSASIIAAACLCATDPSHSSGSPAHPQNLHRRANADRTIALSSESVGAASALVYVKRSAATASPKQCLPPHASPMRPGFPP